MPVEVVAPDPTGPPPDYCCAVLVDAAGRFLLEKRPETKADAPGRLTCFGGLREPREDPAACIARELGEELGFVPPLPAAPGWALHVDGRLIAWFWAAPLDDVPIRLEAGVEAVRLPADELDHPDLSSWHAPVLAAVSRTGSGRTGTYPPRRGP